MTWRQRAAVSVFAVAMVTIVIGAWSKWSPVEMVVWAFVLVAGSVIVAALADGDSTPGGGEWERVEDRERVSRALVSSHGGDPTRERNR